MPRKKSRSAALEGLNPVLFAAAIVGLAFFAQQSYRLIRPRNRRPRWKSQSRHPQIARWESEGGKVPQVQALQSRTKH